MRARKLSDDPVVPKRSGPVESRLRASARPGAPASKPLILQCFFSVAPRGWRSRRRRRAATQTTPVAVRATKALVFRRLVRAANFVGSAARVGGRAAAALVLAAALVTGCRGPGARPGPAPAAPAPLPAGVWSEPQPRGASERYCAWFGDAREGVLYFGESAFWSASRLHGTPLGDRVEKGPRRVGRFDLARRALLAPLDVGPADSPTGVWDVLAHPNGRVYYTTWFGAMGWVDPESGTVRSLPELGRGLNEIAPGPAGSLLVSRYGDPEDPLATGSVLVASPDGARLAEYPLAPPAGWRTAPKTVGYDAARDEIWVTADLFGPPGAGVRHDTYVLDGAGRERRRIEHPEVQFAAFRPEGGGVVAEVEAGRLELRLRPRAGDDRVVLADAAFPSGIDFVQDIHFAADGRAVVTRWSGAVHVVAPDGALETLRLPALADGGLYYSGALANGRVCATHCGGIEVVCAPLAAAPR